MIFVDRSVPRSVVNALAAVRDDVEWLEPRFRHDTPDPVWLEEAGRSGWLVITRDRRIRTRPRERAAIEDHGVGCFILSYRQPLNPWQILRLIAATLDEMERLFNESARPFIYTVGNDQRFRRYL